MVHRKNPPYTIEELKAKFTIMKKLLGMLGSGFADGAMLVLPLNSK